MWPRDSSVWQPALQVVTVSRPLFVRVKFGNALMRNFTTFMNARPVSNRVPSRTHSLHAGVLATSLSALSSALEWSIRFQYARLCLGVSILCLRKYASASVRVATACKSRLSDLLSSVKGRSRRAGMVVRRLCIPRLPSSAWAWKNPNGMSCGNLSHSRTATLTAWSNLVRIFPKSVLRSERDGA